MGIKQIEKKKQPELTCQIHIVPVYFVLGLNGTQNIQMCPTDGLGHAAIARILLERHCRLFCLLGVFFWSQSHTHSHTHCGSV